MKKALIGGLGILALTTAALAQTETSAPSASVSHQKYFAIVTQSMPPWTVAQLGPFQDLAACEAAVVAGKKARVVGNAVCVADRTN